MTKSFKFNFIWLVRILFFILPILIFGIIFLYANEIKNVFPEEKKSSTDNKKVPIIVNGDKVEYFTEKKLMVASGNVVVKQGDVTLTCDEISLNTFTQEGHARGNVRLEHKDGTLKGENVKYNFKAQTGELVNAAIEYVPFYGKTKLADKVSANELIMKDGYFTTCDLDPPHYRLRARTIDVVTDSRVTAKKATFLVGRFPLFFVPQYVHAFNDRRPRVTVVPGRSKEWGGFVLTAWRYYFNEFLKGRVHVDYRERKDLAHGIDLNYDTKGFGKGLWKYYYMWERNLKAKSRRRRQTDPTTERERFKVQWHHDWQISQRTKAIVEYNRFTDPDFLKNYFYREQERVNQLSTTTYLLVTTSLPGSTLSLYTNKRINRYDTEVEKLPEIKFDITSQPLLGGLYFSSQNSLSNVERKYAHSGKTDGVKRMDTDSFFYLPKKIAFVEVNPRVGERVTYFSRNLYGDSNVVRDAFESGVDVSTKFYRIFDVNSKSLGIEINRLRHIITPSMAYSYIHDPSVSSGNLINFDSIDSLSRTNAATFSLENKLQTKRLSKSSDGKIAQNSVDILRFIATVPYSFDVENSGSSFGNLSFDLEALPYDWLRIEADATYDRRNAYVSAWNADLYADRGDKFTLGLGYRYERKATRELTPSISYRLNPKWKFGFYGQYDMIRGDLKEQEFRVSRDLHCWIFELSYNQTRGMGSTIWFAFKIKAFPEMGFDFDRTYNQPKKGTQFGD